MSYAPPPSPLALSNHLQCGCRAAVQSRMNRLDLRPAAVSARKVEAEEASEASLSRGRPGRVRDARGGLGHRGGKKDGNGNVLATLPPAVVQTLRAAAVEGP